MYLETDHTFTALFDVDLLLDSLVSGNTRFCSRLLFSSLLSWACVYYYNTRKKWTERADILAAIIHRIRIRGSRLELRVV